MLKSKGAEATIIFTSTPLVLSGQSHSLLTSYFGWSVPPIPRRKRESVWLPPNQATRAGPLE